VWVVVNESRTNSLQSKAQSHSHHEMLVSLQGNCFRVGTVVNLSKVNIYLLGAGELSHVHSKEYAINV